MPKPGPRTTYKYSDHFKATAVRLSQIEGIEVQDVAGSLYIHPLMLSRWRKEMREGKIMAKGADVDKEVAGKLKELRRIKKDYKRLKVEHDLLKKPSSSLLLEIRHLRVHPPPQKNVRGDTHV
jgi:transposase